MTKVPHPESDYFGKIDLKNLKRLALAKHDRLEEEERRRLKELHWHRCAGCGMELSEVPFKGTVVHRCFGCNGTFLEAGALEKLCGEEHNIIESLLELFRF